MKTSLALVAALLLAPLSGSAAEAVVEDTGVLAEAAAKVVGRVSADWSYETLRPMLFPKMRNPGRFKTPLENGRALGALAGTGCKGTLEPLGPIPNAVMYRSVCEFEHGRAKVFVGFGIGQNDEPVVFGLDVYPMPAEVPAPVADTAATPATDQAVAAPGPTETSAPAPEGDAPAKE